MNKNSKTQKRRDLRHRFLLDTFFKDGADEYAAKEVGEYVLTKQAGPSGKRQVAIWKKEVFDRSQFVYNKIKTAEAAQ